jgi:hypothetical protein
MKKKLVGFFMHPRNLYIMGMVLTFGLSFSEVIRHRHKNFMIFSEATKLFWKGIAPYGDTWATLTTNLDKFVYGPVFNVLFTPFAFLPQWLGPFMWNFMNFSLYFLAIFTLPDKFSKELKCKIFLFTLLILSTSLHSFQTNIMVAYIFLFAYSLLERDKPFWAILLILLSGFIKVYGIFQLGLLLCYPKFWRNAGYVMLGVVFFFLLPMINTQIGNWTDYYSSWFDMMISHKEGRLLPWHTFYYMQPWGNIIFASIYIQISTLLALTVLFVMNHKRFFTDAFKLQALGILMGWIVLFSNAADTHTYLIAMLGFALWYWSRSERSTIDKVFFYALLVVVMVVPVDLLCPPTVMRFLFGTLSLHLWLVLINWLRMCYLTFVKDYINRHEGTKEDDLKEVAYL